MKNLTGVLLLLILSQLAFSQTTGQQIINKSINYHDPDNNWSSAKIVLGFLDTRPGKEDRSVSLSLDNAGSTVCITRRADNHEITYHIKGNECSFELDGKSDVSEADKENYNLNQERALLLRDFYLYLWGLPMKLKDPGTIVGKEVLQREFNGKPASAVKITYDEQVGSDTWYFYFDPATYELIGYQFYHDESKGDGEFIVLEGLELINNMKIPKSRTWYTNSDSTMLGTDNLVHSFPVHSHKSGL